MIEEYTMTQENLQDLRTALFKAEAASKALADKLDGNSEGIDSLAEISLDYQEQVSRILEDIEMKSINAENDQMDPLTDMHCCICGKQLRRHECRIHTWATFDKSGEMKYQKQGYCCDECDRKGAEPD